MVLAVFVVIYEQSYTTSLVYVKLLIKRYHSLHYWENEKVRMHLVSAYASSVPPSEMCIIQRLNLYMVKKRVSRRSTRQPGFDYFEVDVNNGCIKGSSEST